MASMVQVDDGTKNTPDVPYQAVLDSLYDGVYLVDLERRVRYWNQAAEGLTGYSSDRVVGCRCQDNLLNHVDQEGRQLCFGRCPLQASMDDGKTREAKVYLRHQDGHRVAVMVRTAPILGPGGEITGGVEIFNGSETLLAAMSQVSELEQAATHDPLTGLGNRRLMEQILQRRVSELDRHGQAFSVLFVDIDHFKRFNDSLGHAAGDAMLQTVAKTLRASARNEDEVARWGGEEFVVALGRTGEAQIARPAERFRALVASSKGRLNGHDLTITVSVGGAVAHPGETAEAVVARADAALYRAKEEGRNRVVIDDS